MNIEQILIENLNWIQRKAYSYYSNFDDAEDLASETVYKCLRNAHRFNPTMNFRPWVQTIMENTFISQYNRRKRVLFSSYCAGDEKQYFSYDTADIRADLHQILSIIRDCSRKANCIECVLLYAKGYSYDEIADKVGIKLGTVKSRVFTGRMMLRQALEV